MQVSTNPAASALLAPVQTAAAQAAGTKPSSDSSAVVAASSTTPSASAPTSSTPTSLAPASFDAGSGNGGGADNQGAGASDADPSLAQARQRQQLLAEQKQIQTLAQRDREVRAHEQAHAAVGGKYAGAPVYEYTRGPNGRNYATGGEVSIDIAPVKGDPEATLEKAQVVRRAALAPAEPSSQDRAVAARASQMAAEARAEIAASSSPAPSSDSTRDGSVDSVAADDKDRTDPNSRAGDNRFSVNQELVPAVGSLIDTIA